MQIDFEAISLALQMLAMVSGAVLAAFWIGLVVWTAQDIRSRSRDLLTLLLSILLVLVFNLLGLALYLLLRPKETLAEAYERALEEEMLLQGLENRGFCPNCQRPIEHDFVLCPACRTQLKHPCRRCGRLLQLDWEVCPYCAEPALASAEPAARTTSQVSFGRPDAEPAAAKLSD
jgi:RNA polymerase subunit RPABC4/transcription elongation factor Spt4